MAKDPAFLFYPNDYIGGTMGMTFEEKGAYMELLMLQFNRGHMTSHMIGQTLGQDGGRLWDTIKDKFQEDENGKFFNKRLEEEQNKRKAFTASRRNNKKGINQHTKKNGHMTSHMENENENRDRVIDKDFKGGVGEKVNWDNVYNTQWMEGIGRNNQVSIDELQKYWSTFKKTIEDRDDLYRDAHEYRSHFANWLKQQIENNVAGGGLMKRRNVFTEGPGLVKAKGILTD